MSVFARVIFVFSVTCSVVEGMIENGTVIWTTGSGTFLRGTGIQGYIDNNVPPTVRSTDAGPSVEFFDVAHHYSKGLLLFTDAKRANIYAMNASSPTANSLVVIFTGTSLEVGQICVDWYGDNFYWTDILFGWIGMKQLPDDLSKVDSFNPRFKAIIAKGLDRPSGLTVHPGRRYLFWSDVGKDNVKIERSDLIGNHRTLLVWRGLLRPSVLTLDMDPRDSNNDKLYWSDEARGTIEYCNLDGTDRKILIGRENEGFHGLAVWGDRILATVRGQNKTMVIRKGLENAEPGDSFAANVPMELMTIYTDVSQEEPRQDPCGYFHCDQICVDLYNGGNAKCLCEDGYRVTNNINCEEDTSVLDRQILYTNGSDICRMSINSLHSHVQIGLQVDCSVVHHTRRISRFIVDSRSRLVVYTDGSTVYEVEAFRGNPLILYNSTATISDMAYDWVEKKVYWTERVNRRIMGTHTFASGGFNSEVDIVVSDTEATKLALDPLSRRIFWIDEENIAANLKQRRLDAEGASRISIDALTIDPIDLEFDISSRRLWWYGEKKMVSIREDGTDERSLSSLNDRDHSAIAVFKRFVLLSTIHDDQVLMDVAIVENGQVSHQFPMELSIPFESIEDLHVVADSLQPTAQARCELGNGGCQQICLQEGTTRCACFLGYQLASDNTSCVTSFSEGNFALFTDLTFNTILQVDSGTNAIRAIDIHPDNVVLSAILDTSVASNPRAVWVDRKTLSLKAKILQTQDETSLGQDVSLSSRLAIDMSSGNVYVTTNNSILLVTPQGLSKMIASDLRGAPGSIAVAGCGAWKLVWSESGSSDNNRLVRAEMDGTGQKGIVQDLARPVTDLAVDTDIGTEDPFVYWSSPADDGAGGGGAIHRIRLNSLTGRTRIWISAMTLPTAIDILGNNLYFISKGQRVIKSINKADGSNLATFASLPDVGEMSALFVVKPQSTCDSRCDTCEYGGCSTICLPSHMGHVCACQDGIELKDDGKTCHTVERCTKNPGGRVMEFGGCCRAIPGSVCNVTCANGYTTSRDSVRCLLSGRWDAEAHQMCSSTEVPPSPFPVAMVAGIAAGVVIVIIASVLVCVCWRRYVSRNADSLPPARDLNGTVVSNNINPNYGGFQPRPLTAEYVLPSNGCDLSPEPQQTDWDSNGSINPNPRYRRWPVPERPQLPLPDASGEYMELTEAAEAAIAMPETQYKSESPDDGYLTASQTGSRF